MLLSFLIDGDGSFVRVWPEAKAADAEPHRAHEFDLTSLTLDMVPLANGATVARVRTAVFHACVANRTDAPHAAIFTATLSDVSGTLLCGRALESGRRLEPGATANLTFGFVLPLDFIPHQMALRSIRVTVD